jgi:hypothetical protein
MRSMPKNPDSRETFAASQRCEDDKISEAIER